MKFNKISNNKNYVLIGAGQLGQMAINIWPASLNKPILFLDAEKKGFINGIPIERIDSHKFSSKNIYLLSYFKDSAINVIELFKNKIKQEILTIYDLLESSIPDQFSNGWVGAEEDYLLAQSSMQHFCNEYSKLIYSSVINWRYRRILDTYYPVSPEVNKYDISKYGIKKHKFSFIIDGGSYDLSFVKTLVENEIEWKKLVAFEPEIKRIEKLNKILINSKELIKNNSIPILDSRALWSNEISCWFYANGHLSARIAENPDKTCVLIQTTSLMKVIEEHSIGLNEDILIKLHVEGAEWPIIQSALKMISNMNRLNILINLSHDEDSLIRIPQALASTNKFDLYLDSHALFGEGLTLFAKSKQIKL